MSPKRQAEESPIHLEEEPTPDDGVRMTLYYGVEQLVEVEYVEKKYAATLRGALMLIGGMRTAEDLEE